MAKKEVNERVKPIILHDSESGIDYTLEFNRESIKFAESKGFRPEDVPNFPMTKVPEFFYYAFRMHHKNVSREKTDKFIDELGGIAGFPNGFLERLFMLYQEPFEATKTEEARKNSTLTVEL